MTTVNIVNNNMKKGSDLGVKQYFLLDRELYQVIGLDVDELSADFREHKKDVGDHCRVAVNVQSGYIILVKKSDSVTIVGHVGVYI